MYLPPVQTCSQTMAAVCTCILLYAAFERGVAHVVRVHTEVLLFRYHRQVTADGGSRDRGGGGGRGGYDTGGTGDVEEVLVANFPNR